MKTSKTSRNTASTKKRLLTARRVGSLPKTVATRLARRGLVYCMPGSESRRVEWGKEVGAVYVDVVLTAAGEDVVSGADRLIDILT